MPWTEATLPKTKAEVVALLNGLESQVAALQAELAVADATITARTLERDAANQAALEESMAHTVTRSERDVLQATVQGFVPKQASLDLMSEWLGSLGAAGITIPLEVVP